MDQRKLPDTEDNTLLLSSGHSWNSGKRVSILASSLGFPLVRVKVTGALYPLRHHPTRKSTPQSPQPTELPLALYRSGIPQEILAKESNPYSVPLWIMTRLMLLRKRRIAALLPVLLYAKSTGPKPLSPGL